MTFFLSIFYEILNIVVFDVLSSVITGIFGGGGTGA